MSCGFFLCVVAVKIAARIISKEARSVECCRPRSKPHGLHTGRVVSGERASEERKFSRKATKIDIRAEMNISGKLGSDRENVRI
jgi:hypothetical protein